MGKHGMEEVLMIGIMAPTLGPWERRISGATKRLMKLRRRAVVRRVTHTTQSDLHTSVLIIQLSFSKRSHTYHKMLQKYLARSARTFAAQAAETRIPQASRTSFRTAQPSTGRTLAGVRSYSAASEPAKAEAAPAKEGEKAAEAEHPHTKELEAKKKEVSEVTVSGL